MRKLSLILVLLLAASWLKAQTMVYLENADSLTFDEMRHGDAQVLYGNVQFRHDDALMYCDSAYFYESNNSLDAFGHVRFVQGDTLFGYCDVLYYDGNAKFARMRRNVELVNRETHLNTDSLNYDRVYDVAWYWKGGQLEDTVNVLTSVWGQYEPNKRKATFSNQVHLTNPRFTMDADTLTYFTYTHVAHITGETVIVYEEETTIYTTLGDYNTSTEQSTLYNHSLIVHSDGKTMTGDTIYYDKRMQWGSAKSNMQIVDSTRQVTLSGNFGEMHEAQWPQGSYSYVTDSALMIDWSDSTMYTYMHADTLRQNEIVYEVVDTLVPRDSIYVPVEHSVRDSLGNDSIWTEQVLTWQAPDTVWRDTSFQIVRGYYGVRIYREDMQAIADSAIYISRDSIMMLFGEPVCWNDNQQIAADHIDIYFRDSTIDYAHGIGNCIAIQQQTPEYYNQMAGKEMFAYIRDGEMRQVDVNGNAETIFFPKDDNDGSWIGVNKTQSSFVKLFIENQAIHHVLFTTATTGCLYPMGQLSEAETHLSQFFWAEAERPMVPGDVFLRPERTPRGSGVSAPPAAAPDSGKRGSGRNGISESRGGQRTSAGAAMPSAPSEQSAGGNTPTPATAQPLESASPTPAAAGSKTQASGLLKKK